MPLDYAGLAQGIGIIAAVTFLAASALLVYIRARSRASFITDILLRSALPLGLVVLTLLLVVEPGSMGERDAITWLAVQSTFLVLAFFVYAVPAFFLWRTLKHLDGFVIISRGLLEGIHVRLESMYGPGPARIIAYAVGKEAGFNDSRDAVKQGVLKGDNIWKWLPYIFRLTGLGKLELVGEARDELRLRVTDCFEVFEGHSHSAEPNGCDLTRGYLAGVGKAVRPEKECQAEETRCGQIHGGDECEFVVRWFEPVKLAAEA